MIDDGGVPKQVTYGEIDEKAVDMEFLRMPFVWNSLEVVFPLSICHVMRGCDCADINQKNEEAHAKDMHRTLLYSP